MRRRLAGSTLSAASVVLILSGQVTAQEVFYVDPSGSDANPGTATLPLQSMQGAADTVRDVLDGAGDIVVNFNTGTYTFESTVVLGPSDSGTATQSITYRAAPGHAPVFSSLVQVTGWSSFSGNVMQAPRPVGLGHVRYLQDASEPWMERSATASFVADETATCIECTWDDPPFQANKSNVRYPNGFDTPNWAFANQYDLRESPHAWTMEILPIASVAIGQRRIFTTIPALYEIRNDTVEEDIPNNNWILNSIEGIDSPGEWADVNGTIYLWPLSGTGDIFVPRITELVRVDAGGDGNTWSGTPVQNIHFEGITFTGGDFYVMKAGDITTQHDWSVVDEATALLRFRNARDSSVRQCTFAKSGSTGVRLDRYAQNISIMESTFSALGREAIALTGRGPGYGDVNTGNVIRSNHITATGREKWTAPAIMVDQSSQNTIALNYVADTYFTALALTGPRQLAMASVAEFSPSLLATVREFHYHEFSPATVSLVQGFAELEEGAREGMQHVYNVGNRVEENAFVDVCTAQGFLVNGYVYTSGIQRHGTNILARNYIYDSKNNAQNNMVFYSDSDQDNCDYVGNMINNVTNGDAGPEPFPLHVLFAQWAEFDPPDNAPSGTIRLTAGATLDSTYGSYVDGLNVVEDGTIRDGTGGSAAYLDTYEEMWELLCPGTLPGPTPLPGALAMQTNLAAKIVEFGGTVPTCCSDPANDGLPCDDGNACTENDRCQSLVCTGDAATNGSACDDADLCTAPDTCQAGTCTSGAGICSDHFLAYKAKGSRVANNTLPKNWNLVLDDTLLDNAAADDPEVYEVRKARSLLNPATKNDEAGPADPNLHYVRYQVREGKQGLAVSSKAVRHVRRRWALTNQFGTVIVDSKKVTSLLVPAAKDLSSPPTPPADTDHFLCYQVKAARGVISDQAPAGKFRKDLQAYLADQFADCLTDVDGETPFAGTAVASTCLYDLQKPVEFCSPAIKSAVAGGQATSAVIDGSTPTLTTGLLCYQARLAKKYETAPVATLGAGVVGDRISPQQSRHIKRRLRDGTQAYTAPGNRFPAPTQMDTTKTEMVCIPSLVTGVGLL